MKGMFRLALSSYVLVLSASAPALALQESGLVSTRVSMMDPALVGQPTAASVAVRAERPARVARVRLPHASAAAAETLAIVVRGPSQVSTATTVAYRAAVGNGRNDSRYYYWWFAASCARRIGCAPSSYTLVAEGLGRDSVTLAVSSTTAERNLVVQVAELDAAHRTGSSPMFVVAGPAQRVTVGAQPAARPSCDWFAGDFYPHTGDFTDPYTGQSWPRKFRRDYCGNRVQWAPEG